MNNMLDDVRLDAIAKLRDAKEGQEELLETAEDVLTLLDVIRTQGLLALEDMSEEMEDSFLKRLILLMVNGTDLELMVEIATNEYWVDAPDGVMAMVDYMFLRGILGIQKGESESVLTEMLLSLMPSPQRQAYQVQKETEKKEEERRHKKEVEEKFFHTCPENYDIKIPDTIRGLEEDILKLPDLCVQRIVRDVDSDDLAVCVYGFGKRAREKIIYNLSKRYADVIKEKVAGLSHVSEKRMSDCGENVLEVIRVLVKRGEIIYESGGK